MTLKEYGELIINSKKEDWNIIPCWGAGAGPSYLNSLSVWEQGGEFSNLEVEYHAMLGVYKPDLDITIAWGLESNPDFVSEWANNFPDGQASSSFLDFFLRGQLIYRDLYVTVDGGRVNIPLPILRSSGQEESSKKIRRVVPREKYEFFKLFNSFESLHDYQNYFERTGLEIVDESWIQ